MKCDGRFLPLFVVVAVAISQTLSTIAMLLRTPEAEGWYMLGLIVNVALSVVIWVVAVGTAVLLHKLSRRREGYKETDEHE